MHFPLLSCIVYMDSFDHKTLLSLFACVLNQDSLDGRLTLPTLRGDSIPYHCRGREIQTEVKFTLLGLKTPANLVTVHKVAPLNV